MTAGSSDTIAFNVMGRAAPQGSKRPIRRGDHVSLVESSTRLPAWRTAVTDAAVKARNGRPPLTGPVLLTLSCAFVRPKSHFGTGRNAAVLKPDAPPFPITRQYGDADKLLRAVMDALTDAGVWLDDAQVVCFRPAPIKTWGLEACALVAVEPYRP